MLARFLHVFSTELDRKYFYLKVKIPDLLVPRNSHFAALFKHYVLKSQIVSFIFDQMVKMTKNWTFLEWPEVLIDFLKIVKNDDFMAIWPTNFSQFVRKFYRQMR